MFKQFISYYFGFWFLVLGLSLSACQSTLPPTSPPAPTTSLNSSDTIDTLDSSNASLKDTNTWTKFSFSTLSLSLPKNWQVSFLNNNHTQINIKTIPTPGFNHPEFTLEITVTPLDPSNVSLSTPTKINQSPTQIVYRIDQDSTKQSLTLTFSQTNNYPDMITDILLSIQPSSHHST